MVDNRKLVDESMAYERVATRLKSCIDLVMNDWDQHRSSHDSSYATTIGILGATARACEKHSNEVWEAAEKNMDPPDIIIENLANAIVMTSVSDYEKLVSGASYETFDCNIDEIQNFWEESAFGLTGLDMRGIQGSIDKAAEQFAKIVDKYGEEIVQQTNEARKARKGNILNDRLTHKCPLCGNKLYSYGKKKNGGQLIKCSGCDLSSVWMGHKQKRAV